LFEAGVKIVGTSIDSIDRAEDRGRFSELVESLHLRQPASGTARTLEEARKVADRLGFPVLVRPSYVLGGRAMEICDDQERLGAFVSEAARASPDHPILIDKYIEEAVEVDVDAIADGETVVVGGVMEHIEEAGIHSGDSTCTLPAFSLRPKIVDEIRRQTHALARALEVRGLMNIQFAVKDDLVYILEVNPRASRTVPFVCKATGVPLAKLATKVMVGRTLRDLGFTKEPRPALMCVKMPVFPWAKFQGADIRYGPEMRSTGEVMGMDQGFGTALAKAQMGALFPLPTGGKVFISVRDSDKHAVLDIAGQLVHLGFELLSTAGTHRVLTRNGIAVTMLRKISEGKPNLLELLIGGEVAMVINTPSGFARRRDEMTIRRETILRQVPLISTIAAARAALEGIQALQHGGCTPRALQDFHPAASPLA
ncbi:MAG: ATP-grasp domain-containing protein, partial [Planctomycetes bacterium]|nr:ATP-grasp domain-containing protein [Planctomycetota bacterium]